MLIYISVAITYFIIGGVVGYMSCEEENKKLKKKIKKLKKQLNKED